MKMIQRSTIAVALASLALGGLASNCWAGEYHLVKTIQVPGEPIKTVDFSTMDQENGMMYVSDRSNRGIDVIDTNNDTYVRRYGGFRGVFNKPETSGPNIGVREGNVIWVTDAPSNIKAVDLDSGKILATFDCGGGNARIDGAALDPKNHVLMGESADSNVPYLCWIDTKAMKMIGKSDLMHEATAGLEGSVWDARTNSFYLALPEVDHVAGAIYQIDATSRKVIKKYPLPAGDECGQSDPDRR